MAMQAKENVFQFHTKSELVTGAPAERIRAVRSREDKDFVFGGLFPIHTRAGCKEVRQERGLERMEAMLFALDKINNDSDILPDLDIGYDIRDTCDSETVGLDEAIDLIGSNYDDADLDLSIESCEPGPANNISTAVPILGIIGAASSRVNVPVATLARLFRMPQISYASTSALLNERERYEYIYSEYFHRTVPSDSLQATAMADILQHFGWNLVSVVYSDDTYGEPGIDEFRREAAKRNICIVFDKGIPKTGLDYDKLVNDLVSKGPRVVIMFAGQEAVEQLLTRIHDNDTLQRNFTWIASDSWARSINLVHKFNETAAGLFGIVPYSYHHQEFEEYFSQLTIESNQRNGWFPEFFAAFANCTLQDTCDNTTSITSFSRYKQGSFIPLVIDAVYAMAHALHDFLTDNCKATADKPYIWFRNNATCSGQSRQLNRSSLLEYIQNVNFTSITGTHISFDDSGNVKGRYEIIQYQASGSGDDLTYSFKSVGTWEHVSVSSLNETKDGLKINNDDLQFGLNEDNTTRTTPIDSHCGRCGPGSYAKYVPGSCCRICEPCQGVKYSAESQAEECKKCPNEAPREMWGNNPLKGSNSCVPIPKVSVSYRNPWAIPSLLLGSVGLVLVIVTAIIFAYFWKTAVVKSSGREQMILLLIGITCSYLLAFFYLAPPSIPICLIQRLGIWFCYSLMFSALLVKVQRVARIFYSVKQKRIHPPHFVSPVWLVTFTLVLVAIQLCLIICSLSFNHPTVDHTIRLNSDNNHALPDLVITCTEEHIAIIVLSILYETTLIGIATALGAFSFKYPENFNEAKYISFCTFALLIVWIGLIPTYFTTKSQQEYQNAAISFFVILSAYAMHILIFGPKLYIVIFQPKRNNAKFSTYHSNTLSRVDDREIGHSSMHRTYKNSKFLVAELTYVTLRANSVDFNCLPPPFTYG